jgi:hypothetical protein
MPRFRSALPAVVAVTLAGFAAAGCSSDGGDGAAATTSTTSPLLATATIDTVSPLDALRGEQSLSNAESMAIERQFQARVAECMRERGWEYTPVEPYDPTVDRGPEYGTSAYGPSYGYGAVQHWRLDHGGSSGFDDDPNSDYVNSLGDEQGQRYSDDLNGKFDSDGTLVAGSEGCFSVASGEVWGDDPVDSVEGVRARYDAAVAELARDPEVTSARQAWYECLSGAAGPIEIGGRAITSPDDMDDYVMSLLLLASGADVFSFTDGNSAEPDLEFGESLADGSFWGGRGEGSVSGDDLEEIRIRELDLWAQDQDCRSSSGLDEVEHRVEQRLADEIVAEFPEITAAAAAAE